MAKMLVDIHGVSSSETGAAPQSILLLASRQAIYQSLAEAFRQHFSTHDVVLAEGAGRLPAMAMSLRLVLISVRAGDEEELAALVAQVRKQVPGIPVGLLIDEDRAAADLSVIGAVEGVLPLSLPLDVLMAVASLLLAGGQYLPNGSVKRQSVVSLSEETQVADTVAAVPVEHAPVEINVGVLTNREEQILQYVSEGFQNKLIADRMALSEHTVKAHVHKVIAKLGVSNRTQAAAAFLRRKNGGTRAPVRAEIEARQP